MQLISAGGLSKKYGVTVCFDDASFQIHTRQRIGLIGLNGTGKTTLFRILLGEEPFEGTLNKRKGMTIACLEQNPQFAENDGIIVNVMESAREVAEIERRIEGIHNELATCEDTDSIEKLLARLSGLEKEFEIAGGHDIERRAEAILEGFGFSADRHHQKVCDLSGGERNRVALARLLLHQPDLWLFDEPTNHLDLTGIDFLERFLTSTNAAAIIISHDRRFLDRVTNETWEIESNRIQSYPGSYSKSRDIREERKLAAWNEYEQQRDYIKKQEDYIRKYKAGQRAREAKGREKRLHRLERITRPQEQATLESLHLPPCERLGNDVLEVNGLEMGYEERTLFHKLSFEIEPGESFCIVGPNGSGKTTLVNLLLGEAESRAGSIKWGKSVKVGYIGQHDSFPDESLSPMEYLLGCENANGEQDLRDTLAAMLFRGDDADRPMRHFSGGEKRRLMLTRLLLEGHNVLVLDEPTNHLDIASREALETALSAYGGCLIVISHDRFLLDQIADRVLWLENGQCRITPGGYSAALEAHAVANQKSQKQTKKNQQQPHNENEKTKSSGPYSGLSTTVLERKIIEHEEKIEEINSQFSLEDVYTNPEKMKKLQADLSETKNTLDELEAEYVLR